MGRFALDWNVRIPEHVVVREIGAETVVLNLDSDEYFGLDEVAAEMFRTVLAADTLGAARDELLECFDVEPSVLETDLLALIERLTADGLIEIDRLDVVA